MSRAGTSAVVKSPDGRKRVAPEMPSEDSVTRRHWTHAGVNAPELYCASTFASLSIALPIGDVGLTSYGSFPAKPLSMLSASAMVLAIGAGLEPFAMLSFATMS